MIPSKILVIKWRSLGDTVLLTAALDELKKAYPNAEIHVTVTDRWAEVLEHHPAIDRIWPYMRHGDKGARAKAVARMALQLRKERFDLALNFHASTSSAMLAFASGAKVRSIHHHGKRQTHRFSTVTMPDGGKLKPVIDRDMDTLRALGLSIPSGQMPKLYLSKEEVADAKAFLEKEALKGPILAVGLSASRRTKIWPLDRTAEICRRWVNQTGGSVFVPVTSGERVLTEAFRGFIGGSFRIGLYEDLSLRKVAAIFSHADVFVGNDSGPKHMAVAVGTPTVTMIGPEHPFEWHPYPRDAHPYFFVEGLACRTEGPKDYRWCGLKDCVVEKHKCMTQLEVGHVWDTLIKFAGHKK